MRQNNFIGNLGLHVIQYPTGRFGFVGNVPAALGQHVPATTADVTGGRAFEVDGQILTIKFPSFDTRDDAIGFAQSLGFASK